MEDRMVSEMQFDFDVRDDREHVLRVEYACDQHEIVNIDRISLVVMLHGKEYLRDVTRRIIENDKHWKLYDRIWDAAGQDRYSYLTVCDEWRAECRDDAQEGW
jgi:hypothetical protein